MYLNILTTLLQNKFTSDHSVSNSPFKFDLQGIFVDLQKSSLLPTLVL